MTIKKAVFPVAGFGTRFLPATKAMPKELLPIVDKPLIQYAVEEAIRAGVEILIFVTGRNKRAIEDHFDNTPELENALRAKGMHEQAKMVKNILPENVSCVFVRQSEQLGLGHAVNCAKSVVGDEPFAVLLADDFITSEKSNTTAQLCDAFKKSNKIQLSVTEINGPEISKYGVVLPGINPNSVKGLIEKPTLDVAPSNLASIGRYILTPKIFDILENLPPSTNGEIQLADAINLLAKNDKNDLVQYCSLVENRFDCGSVEGFIMATNYEFSRRKNTV